jgi:hypothetical protein
VAGEEETDCQLLFLQALTLGPRADTDKIRGRTGSLGQHVEQTALHRIRRRLFGRLHRQRHGRHQLRAIQPLVRLKTIHRTGADQGLDDAAVGHAPVNPRTKIKQVAKRPALLARGEHCPHRGLAHPFHCAQTVADRLAVHRHEAVVGGVHIRRQHRDAVGDRIFVEDLDRVGVVQVG